VEPARDTGLGAALLIKIRNRINERTWQERAATAQQKVEEVQQTFVQVKEAAGKKIEERKVALAQSIDAMAESMNRAKEAVAKEVEAAAETLKQAAQKATGAAAEEINNKLAELQKVKDEEVEAISAQFEEQAGMLKKEIAETKRLASEKILNPLKNVWSRVSSVASKAKEVGSAAIAKAQTIASNVAFISGINDEIAKAQEYAAEVKRIETEEGYSYDEFKKKFKDNAELLAGYENTFNQFKKLITDYESKIDEVAEQLTALRNVMELGSAQGAEDRTAEVKQLAEEAEKNVKAARALKVELDQEVQELRMQLVPTTPPPAVPKKIAPPLPTALNPAQEKRLQFENQISELKDEAASALVRVDGLSSEATGISNATMIAAEKPENNTYAFRTARTTIDEKYKLITENLKGLTNIAEKRLPAKLKDLTSEFINNEVAAGREAVVESKIKDARQLVITAEDLGARAQKAFKELLDAAVGIGMAQEREQQE
jgi:hypothetical protein